jgi:hypothetical protein
MAERYDNSRRSANGSRRAASPARAAATRARSRVADVPVTRKILLTLMVMGAMTTAVGAGTFASLTAATSNPSVFSTGTLVLSDQVNTGNTCFSNGTTASNGGVGTPTDVNANTACDLIFDAATGTTSTHKRPGESAVATVHLQNAGTILGNLSAAAPIDCTDSDAVDQPGPPYGTPGTGCDGVQLSIEDTAAGVCYWGDNMGTSSTKPYITGAPLTFPVTIRSATDSEGNTANNLFKITVDALTARDNVLIPNGTYNDMAALLVAVNGAISNSGAGVALNTYATATAVGDAIKIESLTATASSKVTLAIPATAANTALTTLGFMDGSSAAGPGKCATKTGDRDHTLADFRAATLTTPLAMGTIAGSTTRNLTVTLGVPAVLPDTMQARLTSFALTWQLLS